MIILTVGAVLGAIGSVAFPMRSHAAYFWPAAALQATGGILFGWTGVFAATLFPSLSNAFTDESFVYVIGFIPINFIQSAIPLLVKKIMKISPYLRNRRELYIFIIGCTIFPNVIGALLVCGLLYFSHHVCSFNDCCITLRTWFIGNTLCSLIFGPLLLKTLGPALKDCDLVNETDS